MKIFVSGATGFIGSHLALRLAEQGHAVHAMNRTGYKAGAVHHPNIQFFQGDILDQVSLEAAMAGCEQVYHLAAFAKAWDKNPAVIYRQNIQGALCVIKAASKVGASRIVLTSTAGTLGPSGAGEVDETAAPARYFTDYESSKAIMEQMAQAFAQSGLHVVLVNPTRVYGPGVMSESNAVTKMMASYRRGKWRIIPGNGKSVGNYAFVEDVVEGHLLAMEKGRPGERYILGGENASYNEFFALLAELTGERYAMLKLPVPIMLGVSSFLLLLAQLFGIRPAITPALARKYAQDFRVSSAKAKQELGYQPLSLREGMQRTLEAL